MKPQLSLTIPIYNEEKGIKQTINNLIYELKKSRIDYQLVLVNHGSFDNTEGILKGLGEKNKRLKIINLEKNLCYGGGIQHGFENSEGEYIGFTCADEEILAQDVCKIFLALINSSYDVSKSRRMKRKDGFIRIITTTVFNLIILFRFNLRLKDVNGYPIFMKRAIFPEVKSKEKAYLFNLDILRNIKKRKYKTIEIPVIHQERKAGKSFMNPFRILYMAWGVLKYSI